MSRVVIENGIIFTGDEILDSGTILLEGETIAALRTGAVEQQEQDERFDAGGRLVTPGLINGHTHIYSALARGMPLKDPPPVRFTEILERVWWRLDRALTLEEIDLSARLHGIESLHNGVTTLFDHHASQRTIDGSLTTLSEALAELGLRACLCFEVSDRDGADAVGEGIAENLAFLDAAADDSAMRAGKFGLHAAFTLSDATLSACREAMQGREDGYHVHLAEDRADDPQAVARLERNGMLGTKTIGIHGVHLDQDAIARLAETETWLIHCPESNLHNAVGLPDLPSIDAAGVRVGLGTDGFTAAMVRESLVAHLVQSHRAADPRVGYMSVGPLLFEANGRLARETFGVDLGRLVPGSPADLVIWDYVPPTPLTRENLYGHQLFGLVGCRAREVWIAGQRVLAQGRVTGCDEDAVTTQCREAAARLWKRF